MVGKSARIELPPRPKLGGGGFPKGALILMGGMATLLGSVYLLVGNRVDGVSDSSSSAMGVGLFLVLVGLGFFAAVVKDNIRVRRLRARLAAAPSQPWRGDFAWDAAGSFEVSRRPLRLAGLLLLFGAPAVWGHAAMIEGQIPWFPWVIGFLLLDLVCIFTFWSLVRALTHRLVHGRKRFAFSSFPFFLGSTLNGEIVLGRRPGAGSKLRVVLRHVIETRESQGQQGSRDRFHSQWSDTLEVDPVTAAEGRIPVVFSLPREDQMTTRIEHGAPVRYWEIATRLVDAPTSLEDRFLVPVYSRTFTLEEPDDDG